MSRRVLVIESEPWLAEQFERALTKAHFEVTTVSNAYSAIDIVDNIKPSAVVMGLMLSGVNGVALLHELQSYMDTARIPIIVCGGPTIDLSLEELRPYGAERLLDVSTMQPDDLAGAVRSVLHVA